ncbi:amidohydrolase family protein [Lysobacter sp. KIS68-7]|uniref:amidohydrolase family protein n=1 Tax=Lysobacter sp. KIS68-7 TaxID=2904252 RepID=UPI001E4A56A3|nr:amidohydrolase family protein [Lysobacter sp. KIS68-7]UHQ21079.1 amidohydrolase family protein [Lysobacter sp. KIS68-7]
MTRALVAACALALSGSVFAQDVLIRHAKVHTATAKGTLDNADVLVRNGRISAVGTGLAAGNATVVEANGRELTPAFFGGITDIGLEEVSGEQTTVDSAQSLGAGTHEMTVRPEFDVTLAFNPASVLIPVARVEGLGWTMLSAGPTEGGSIIGGQGGVVRLDGSMEPVGPRALFVSIGSGAASMTGNSRAAQWMVLDQLVDEARGRIAPDSKFALLTPAGRKSFAQFLDRRGLMVFNVNRASDIVQLLRWSKRQNVRVAVAGGAEAWEVADQLAAAKVPVFVDTLADLPQDFDQIGATLDNAARLRTAGVPVAILGAGSHHARKVRQMAGIAVANGLPWEDGLASLTRVPAEAFGVANDFGTIAPGQRADLVLWDGDPLDVTSLAQQVWLGGQAVPMRSRQTELRDRYMHAPNGLPRAYPAGSE